MNANELSNELKIDYVSNKAKKIPFDIIFRIHFFILNNEGKLPFQILSYKCSENKEKKKTCGKLFQ